MGLSSTAFNEAQPKTKQKKIEYINMFQTAAIAVSVNEASFHWNHNCIW